MGSNGKHPSNMITVLDVGSAKTVALICEATDAGLRYRGHGMAESRGSRKGIIVELDKAVQSIHKAVEEAEKAWRMPGGERRDLRGRLAY